MQVSLCPIGPACEPAAFNPDNGHQNEQSPPCYIFGQALRTTYLINRF